MKILLCPSDLGGGHGHLSRCNAIAYEATRVGHQTAFILHKSDIIRKIRKRHRVFPANWESVSYHILKKFYSALHIKKGKPVYTYIPNLNYQVIRDGLISPEVFLRAFNDYTKIINNYKPDVIIGDTNLVIGPVAKKHNIPIIQLVRKGSWYKSPQIIWWEPIRNEVITPDITGVFNPILERLNLDIINKAEDLLKGDVYTVPSIPEFEPIEDGKVIYLGPILEKNRQDLIQKGITKSSRPLIYITIGAGAQNIGSIQFFNFIMDTFKDMDWEVYISTAFVVDARKIKNPYTNIHFYNWLPGRKMMELADLVIFHGGYGTMMEVIKAGKPSIVIPFHSEQESNGRRIVRNRLGEICELSLSNYQVTEHKSGSLKFTTLMKYEFNMSKDDLLAKIKNILNNRTVFNKRCRELTNKYESYTGVDLLVRKYLGIKR